MNSNAKSEQGQLFYSGTSNLVIPVANKSFYPEEYRDKSRLTYYASLFNSAEINSSFKKLPMKKTVEKWAAMVPDHFRFTFKMWKGITHNKALDFKAEDVAAFFNVVDAIGKKKGCLLVQFPGKLTLEYASQLENLMTSIRLVAPECDWKIALEFRHRSWYIREVYELLAEYDMGLVFHDMPASAPTLTDFNSDFVYLRFHGPEKGYKGSYSNEFLNRYAQQIRLWNEEGKPVYAYFNNTLGDAVNNLMTLNRSFAL